MSQNISILLLRKNKKEQRKEKASLLDKSDARMAADANNTIDFALLRFTRSIHYQRVLQIETDVTGSLKLTAKGCLPITLSIPSPALSPLTASSSVFQPAVKPASPPFPPSRKSLPEDFGALGQALLNNSIHLCLPSMARGAPINQ